MINTWSNVKLIRSLQAHTYGRLLSALPLDALTALGKAAETIFM